MSKPELNLDVDAPERVADVLRAAADMYQQGAEERIAAQPDDRTPVIWAGIAGLLDGTADAIERMIKRRLVPKK